MSARAEQGGTGARAEGSRALAEWVSFGVAAVILTMVAGLVVLLWLREPLAPPVVTVARAGEVREAGGQFYLPVSVTNDGGLTADAVEVVAELRVGGELVETGTLEFTFLSGGETEEGVFIFSEDPRRGELRLRAGSYRLA